GEEIETGEISEERAGVLGAFDRALASKWFWIVLGAAIILGYLAYRRGMFKKFKSNIAKDIDEK
ncbi:MAG: hypothetical protein WC993_10480, partial [Methanoculleus sp.]